MAVCSEDTYLRMAGGYDEADDYQDSDGKEVRSAYENAERQTIDQLFSVT